LEIRPLYLLADSQLLFLGQDKNSLTRRLQQDLPENPKAAYIGASNDYQSQFYDLFLAAMDLIAVRDCRMIPEQLADSDRAFLEEASLVLLSGGDSERGWHVFVQNGIKETLLRKRYDGSVLVGVSAGAVQLALGALSEETQPKVIDMFGFAPFYIGAHEENEDWWNLRALVNLSRNDVCGIGIPAGGGAIYSPDGTLEPVRRPLIEVVKEQGIVKERLLLPQE
jgi:cyanophycinase-like exopeptidase